MYFNFAASVLTIPARIFPIYFPMGNMATGYFVIFSLIAGVVGVVTSVTGLNNVVQWDAPNLGAATASSLLAWSLTLLAMGLVLQLYVHLQFFFFIFFGSFQFLYIFLIMCLTLLFADWHVNRSTLAVQIRIW